MFLEGFLHALPTRIAFLPDSLLFEDTKFACDMVKTKLIRDRFSGSRHIHSKSTITQQPVTAIVAPYIEPSVESNHRACAPLVAALR